ncbi:DNA repair protein RecN [Candidatus Latescibacterota bacterium]
MLESLTIRNYAIIDELTADFTGGLNIITGETGAGKSIVVDALELVLGARASAEMIRAGADFLEVSGVFILDKSLIEEALPGDVDNDILILRREVRADGNNRCFVNDRPVTLRVLKELGDRLVDFHGQHDHQSLLVVAEHVTFLDGYGRLIPLAREVKNLFNRLICIRDTIEKQKQKIDASNRDRELYAYQLEEIEKVSISPGEDTELESSIQKLGQAGDLKALGWKIFNLFSEAEGSITDRLGGISSEINELSRFDPELAHYRDNLEELTAGVEDMAHFFRTYAENIDDDPGLLTELEDRLALIESLKRKYGTSFDDVFAHRDSIKAKLKSADYSEEKLAKLESERDEIISRLVRCASDLSKKRRQTAPNLVEEVESHLAELGMSGARVIIDIRDCEGDEMLDVDGQSVPVTKNGFDRVEFMISANPGEPPKPLVKVASGGEISRVMLSLKLVLLDANNIPTMVFDEIDSGVSGRVAEAVGTKLMKLTKKRQVLVITHLPQIAVMAHRHFSARKTVKEGRTQAGLVLLDEKTRQSELASLLSGEKLTETALAHAKELIKTTKHKK